MDTFTTSTGLVLDIVGVFVFALSGGLVAVRKGLDLFGVLALATVAGLGGGIVRDVLIGDTPPVGITDWRLLLAAGLAGVATFLFHPSVARIARVVRVLDAAGLAAFTVAGTLKALAAGLGPVPAVLVGCISAVGGGVIRDVLAGQVPEVLRRELYAVPSLLGGTILVTAHGLDVISPVVVWGSVAFVFTVRMVAVVLDLNAPVALRTGEHP